MVKRRKEVQSMKGAWIRITIVLLVVAAALIAGSQLEEDYLSLHNVKQQKEQLLAFIRTHYLQAVFSYIGLYICTALFLPGALALTVAGGMMFGTIPAALYTNIGATAGAVTAFLAARFVIGSWLQERFRQQLYSFNLEVSSHGKNYLLMLRILPLAPFFVINYCAGLTRIPLKTFVWTTSLGIFPGSLIHAFIGEQLREVSEPADVFSGKIMLALLLLSIFAMLPVIRHFRQRKREKGDAGSR